MRAHLIGAIAFLGLSFSWPVLAQDAAPVVSITGGSVRGTIESGQAVFKSIPFAAPPVGEARWREPQPPMPWTGTLDATRFPVTCIQSRGGGSEDCLYLNI